MKEKKVAVITGGARGIGRAICLRLADDGYDIAFDYRSDDENAELTKKMCEQKGVKVITVKGDVADPAHCKEFVNLSKEFGGGKIDVLINNAGITRDGLIGLMKDDDMDAVLNVNLKGAFYMMREVSRIMIKNRGGKIVNLSSVVGISGNAGQVNYAASKAAVIGMTKSLAKELSSRNINVNAVAPGFIETDMTGKLPPQVKESAVDSIALKRIGKAEEVAGAVSFLCSKDSEYITGQVICVDGGMVI